MSAGDSGLFRSVALLARAAVGLLLAFQALLFLLHGRTFFALRQSAGALYAFGAAVFVLLAVIPAGKGAQTA